MRRLLVSLNRLALLIALSSFWMTLTAAAAEPQPDVTSSETKGVALKWLGVAGWEIRTGRTIVLIDPFLTRKDRSPDAEWKTDEEAVLRVINGADYIFAGHSHADHIGDIPFIAKRFGSKVIGSRTTTNIALTAGVDKSQLVTIQGGEKFDFKDFSVQVIESQHGVLTRGGRRRQPKPQEILEPWSGPIMGNAFVEGGSYLYLFTFGKHRVLHQSTGNFIEENLKGLQPDVAILAENSNYEWATALKILRPKLVIVHHFDERRAPLSWGISKSNMKRAQRLEQQVKSVDGEIKVIIPQFLTTYTLE
ncbi:MAG TPA: MBL fold metallo-hydrolase [Candidatus Binatia bacterium]|nr:MBL fold metallo-hydrolase [Candidatus Binatia bacterium]